MPKISVIMPVYNSEQYIRAAIESVLSQTFTNFELICIDDGSTDSSGEICDEYAQSDSRVVVIHQKNGGISNARNVGLKMSCGEYITFIDNDDEYLPNLLEDNYKLAKKYNADIVKFGCRCREIYVNGENLETDNVYNEFLVCDKSTLAKYYLSLKKSSVLTFIWNGIYKKSFLIDNSLGFNTTLFSGADDVFFNCDCCLYINCLVCNNKAYYLHFARGGISHSRKYFPNKHDEITLVAKHEQQVLSKINISSIWPEILAMYLAQQVSFFFNYNCGIETIKKLDILRNIKLQEPFCDYKEFAMIRRPIKTFIVLSLFYNNKFKTLLFTYKVYSKIMKLWKKQRVLTKIKFQINSLNSYLMNIIIYPRAETALNI